MILPKGNSLDDSIHGLLLLFFKSNKSYLLTVHPMPSVLYIYMMPLKLYNTPMRSNLLFPIYE